MYKIHITTNTKIGGYMNFTAIRIIIKLNFNLLPLRILAERFFIEEIIVFPFRYSFPRTYIILPKTNMRSSSKNALQNIPIHAGKNKIT